MKKPAASAKRPSTLKRPAKKTAAEREKERKLTDRYADVGRQNEQRMGDEPSELEPVGRKKRK
jgi:hypothetical protein